MGEKNGVPALQHRCEVKMKYWEKFRYCRGETAFESAHRWVRRTVSVERVWLFSPFISVAIVDLDLERSCRVYITIILIDARDTEASCKLARSYFVGNLYVNWSGMNDCICVVRIELAHHEQQCGWVHRIENKFARIACPTNCNNSK